MGRAIMNTTPVLLGATVTILIAVFYFYAGFRVGTLRGKHGIKAPRCEGHPEFDRAYRIQLNTLEQMGITLPLLWVSILFPLFGGWIAAALGLVWVISRMLYSASYMADPDKRVAGAMLGGVSNLLLLVTAVVSVGMAWLR
jgi:glutathione S-transferase